MLTVLWRTGVFFSMSIAVIALLPLLAREMPGGDARTFTLLLAAMGSGAVGAAVMLPRLRQRMTRDQLVHGGTLLHASATIIVACVSHPWLAALGMFASGAAWISVANSLTVTAQMSLPDWVKARGMSIYQMSMMGGCALGAALWGQVATVADVRTALVLAAVGAIVGLALLRRAKLGTAAEEDLTPAGHSEIPPVATGIEDDHGPMHIHIEYRIDPARADEFNALMRESRRMRLRNGALSWDLIRDATDPGCYMEHFIEESWAHYRRQRARMTTFELMLTERKMAFHVADSPPATRHFVAPRPRAK
jgi:MFS family permease